MYPDIPVAIVTLDKKFDMVDDTPVYDICEI
jgi:hypothetical protein